MFDVPSWVVTGLLIAGGLAGTSAIIFTLGMRAFPDGQSTTSERTASEWKRRGEIRGFLDAAGERYREDHEVSGCRTAFYLPERDVAITFDGATYYRLKESDTHAILLEHEFPGENLGSRLPFDVNIIGDASPIDMEEAYSVLGIDHGATLSDIESAYRDRIKEVHPDQGGSADQFKRVREAYALAKDRVQESR
ncbi:MAG: J domain-containing protein [Halobacteriaceae archaeon]